MNLQQYLVTNDHAGQKERDEKYTMELGYHYIRGLATIISPNTSKEKANNTSWTAVIIKKKNTGIQIIQIYALLSVEVDILFSPQPSGTEYENRVSQRP